MRTIRSPLRAGGRSDVCFGHEPLSGDVEERPISGSSPSYRRPLKAYVEQVRSLGYLAILRRLIANEG
ncbi:MAG TPA: hypothetical protein VNA27_08225 [Rubrobacteraceae bacterium]|nr:hypothetical protein [Rubrobacteraceae bacterium]